MLDLSFLVLLSDEEEELSADQIRSVLSVLHVTKLLAGRTV